MLRGVAELIETVGDRNRLIVPLLEIRNQLSSRWSCSIEGGSTHERREGAASIPLTVQVRRLRQRSPARMLLTTH